jgi:acyl-CoA synthetase (NDP forming)/GNAT superfamily N-acetyltransferase
MAFELNRMLKPQSVALIGASADPASISGLVAHSVLANLDDPLLPKVHLVNPHHQLLYGQACLSDIKTLPLGIDLVIILTPWAATPDCLEALATRDIGGVVCISIATESSIAGILWQSRKSLLAKLRRQLSRLNLGLIGPSSFGIQLPHAALNASLIPALARAGGVALISQSEAVGGVAAEYCVEQGLGLRALITLGDAIDVNAAELLDYFAKDANTTTVLLQIPYCAVDTAELKVEFLSALRACAQSKATVVWLNPPTLETVESLSDAITDNDILRQGALAVTTLESFCESAHLKQFARVFTPPSVTQKLVLTGNSTALIALCVQAAAATNIELTALPATLIRRLRPLLAARSSIVNPLDLGRDANPTRYTQVAHVLASFSSALMFCHHPNAFSDGHEIAEALCSEASFTQSNTDQLRIAVFTGKAQAPARALLRAHGFAAFDAPGTAMRSLNTRQRLYEIRTASRIQRPQTDSEFANQIVISASGIRMVLRDIQSADEAELQRGFLRLSADEVRMRFMYPLKALTHDLAVRLTQLDPNRDIALVLAAPAPVGEAQIYAVVRASRTPSYRHRIRTDAEFAIVIPQALSGQGLGKKLMLELIKRCQQVGINSLWGDVLAENAPMLALARKLEFNVVKHPDRDFGGGNLVRVIRAI